MNNFTDRELSMGKRINFLGDLIFGDQPVLYGFGLNSIWSKKKYQGLFDGVSNLLNEAEYNIANFETIIKKTDKKKTVSEWSMCCEEDVCSVLKNSNINIVSVANNHTMDYGREWFDYTVKCLTEAGIKIVGLKNQPYVKIRLGKKKIAIIACSYLKINSKEDLGYLCLPSKEIWRNIVKECGDCDIKIAYVHWGNEFVERPTDRQYRYANEIISAGVDLIVGHHPHILQTNEIFGEKKVIFSLGNFVSDYWQKRLRKTEIISYDEFGKLEKINITLNSYGAPVVKEDNYSEICFNENKKPQSVTLKRIRVRTECFFKVLLNFYKIKEKRAFLMWLWRRMKYIVFYGWSELKNPDIVYEHYKN